VDTQVFTAFNRNSKKFVGAGLLVVDAAAEPLKVLKILMEGLGPSTQSGIWFTHFRGIPVAKSHNPFDLIYLDEELRVIQAIEISRDSRFEPFKGQPESALILPHGSVAASKTFTGDRIIIADTQTATPSPAPASAQGSESVTKPVPHPNRIPHPAVTRDIPLQSGPIHQARSTSSASGPLLRSARLVPERPSNPAAAVATIEPPAAPIAAAVFQETVPEQQAASIPLELPPAELMPEAESIAVTASDSISEEPISAPLDEGGVGASLVVAESIPIPAIELMDAPAPTPEPVDDEPAARKFTPTLATYEGSLAESIEAPIMPVAAPNVEKSIQPRQEGRSADDPDKSDAYRLSRRWDVRLLYSLFPKLSPDYRPDFHAPRIDYLKDKKAKAKKKQTLKLRILSWLFPDLNLQTVEQRQREARRAPRVSAPGLVGYFYTGGTSKPHPIRNLSVTGFYMQTSERFLPGTVVRITLQMAGTDGVSPGETLTVHTRVVSWDQDGGGFEFVMPGFLA
jgi:hypothetical protein